MALFGDRDGQVWRASPVFDCLWHSLTYWKYFPIPFCETWAVTLIGTSFKPPVQRIFFLGGGVIYGGHPSALLSSRQCHELRPPFPYADLKHFGLPSSPVETASCHLVHLQNTGCVTPSAILQMRFSHPAMICFALLLKPCPLLQHNNREIMVFARRQHSNSGQPRELWYELVGARMHCMNNCTPSQAAYIAVGVQSSQYTCLI